MAIYYCLTFICIVESFKENSNLQFKSIQKDHLLSFKSISDKEKLILAEKFYMPPHSNRSPIKELKTEKQRCCEVI